MVLGMALGTRFLCHALRIALYLRDDIGTFMKIMQTKTRCPPPFDWRGVHRLSKISCLCVYVFAAPLYVFAAQPPGQTLVGPGTYCRTAL